MSTLSRLPTPFPIGSPHVANPPTFARRGRGKLADRNEKRDYTRRPVHCDLWMIDAASRALVRCKTEDISDAGLHASSPIGFGLAVGQRYEIRLAPSPEVACSPHSAKSLGYGTIVRSGIQLTDGRQDRVGFAISFDVPQLVPI